MGSLKWKFRGKNTKKKTTSNNQILKNGIEKLFEN